MIDSVTLGAFLGANGKNYNDLDILSIIRRIDTNGDATVDLYEWAEFLRVPVDLNAQTLPLEKFDVLPGNGFTN